MLSMQHVMCLYEKNGHPSNRLVAATVYPDAIRAYTGPRQYSHFEKSYDGSDSSYMTFLSDMKAEKDVVTEQLAKTKHLVSDVKPCVIGEETDIQAFYNHNKGLESEMKKGIGYHLQQDMTFDTFIRDEIDCSKKYDDVFEFQGDTFDGKGVRGLIGDIEQHGIYVMAHRLYEKQGITANQAWFEENVKPALDDQYCADLSGKTFSFMKISPAVNQLITEHDWSKLNDGPVALQDYNVLYDTVQKNMDISESKYSNVQRPLPDISNVKSDVDASYDFE